MKTVAISTIHPYYLLSNYGSFWQHYALRKVVASFGFVPFRVYDPKEKLSFWARCRKQAKDLLRPLYRRVIRRVDDKALSATDYCYRRLNRLFLRDYKVLMGRFYEKPRFNADTVGIRGGDQVFYPDTPYRWMADVKSADCVRGERRLGGPARTCRLAGGTRPPAGALHGIGDSRAGGRCACETVGVSRH